jgi:hypothetical protein
MPSTPNTPIHHPSHCGPFLSASEVAPNSGQTSPSPVASTGGRSGQSGTLLGATGGTQTHSRRTRSKLRQLHCTRQGLVRVPESNTKYGGKRRKTGVASGSQCRQVSVSPQGFPSEKNCLHRADFSFVPLFTGQLFIVPEGLLLGDSGRATQLRAAMPAWRWPLAPRTGKVRSRELSCLSMIFSENRFPLFRIMLYSHRLIP